MAAHLKAIVGMLLHPLNAGEGGGDRLLDRHISLFCYASFRVIAIDSCHVEATLWRVGNPWEIEKRGL